MALNSKWQLTGAALVLLVLIGAVLMFPRNPTDNPSIGIYY